MRALIDGVLSGERAVRARLRTTSFEAPTSVAAEFPEGVLTGASEAELPFAAATLAAEEALAEARLDDRERLGVVLATTKADLSGVVGEGAGFGFPARLAQRVADAVEARGPVASVSTACASGLTALATAERRLALGEADAMLVVGVDVINQFIMAGFGAMRILDPVPCRPYDLTRVGISLGDGAGAVVLTRDEAHSLGARITGHGGANDAISVTGCHREGLGVALATRRALARAGRDPRDIDLVHLHGTGTKASDFSEATGLGVVYDGLTPPALGTKGQTGHTLGAAGVLETLVALGCLERGRVPANVGLTEPNVDPRLSLVREPERLDRARAALKVSGGFGGIQQVVVLEV